MICAGISNERPTLDAAIAVWLATSTFAFADQHVIVSEPGFDNGVNKKVFFGNDGGVFRTDDISAVEQYAGWWDLNRTLGITQFYGGAASGEFGIDSVLWGSTGVWR